MVDGLLGAFTPPARTVTDPAPDPQRVARGGKGNRLRGGAINPLRPPRQATLGDGLLRFVSEKLLNGITNSPKIPGLLTAAAIEGVGGLVGEDLSEFADQFVLDADLPSATDVFAAEKTLLDLPGAVMRGEAPEIADRFGANQVQQQLESERIHRQAPIGSMLGGLLGDMITIGTGRAPFVVAAGKRPALVEKITKGPKPQVTLPTIAKNVANSAPVKRVLRGLGRAGETTLEAAVLTALQSDDPTDVLAVSAGSGLAQLGGSAALQFFPKSKKGLGGLLIAAGGMTSVFRLAQEFGPGEPDVFKALDTSMDKLAISLFAGVMAGLGGLNRTNPRNMDALTSLMFDGFTTMRRSAVISMFKEIRLEQSEGRNTIEAGFAEALSNPEDLTRADIRSIERAITDPDVSLSKTFQRLGIGVGAE